MEIKIYQNYYLPEQRAHLDPAFVPYDNIENKEPELREYPILKKLQQMHKDDDLWWGLTSWRWEEKTRTPGKLFIDKIVQNSGHDVYHLNYDIVSANKSRNIFVQGDMHHKGMIKYFERLCQVAQFNVNVHKEYDKKYFITCHNYVLHSSMWNKWIAFLDFCIEISKKDDQLNNYLYIETSVRYKKAIPNFSFVVERLIALFSIVYELRVMSLMLITDSRSHVPNRLRPK